MSNVLLMDHPAAGVLRLRINRPDKRNAIDHAVRQALIDALLATRSDASVRAIVFGGVDRVFSAGGDVPSMVGLTEAQARERMRHIHELCQLVAGLPMPVVAAAEGFCAGAVVGLALLGDHIVVGKATKILFPFFKLGLAPDWGMLRTLPARVGLRNARRLLLTSEPIAGEDAYALGLADDYVGDADVMAAAITRAQTLAALPQDAFTRMKRRLNDPAPSLDAELQREEDDQAVLLLGEDFREGYAAFSEKRATDFVTPKKANP